MNASPSLAPASQATSEDLLEIDRVSVRFGGVFAVRDVSLTVRRGNLHGLIGPNGAGKTTLIDAITGFEACHRGHIRFKGHRIDRWAPHRRANAGVVRTFQNLELFPDLTVEDNLQVAAGSLIARSADTAGVVERMGIGDVLGREVSRLPHGVQRLVSIARALVTSPELLILDEPAAGLDTDETKQLGHTFRSIVGSGITILLVDHDMHLVMDVCNTIDVLSAGTNLTSGNPAQIAADPDVRRVYLGEIA